MLLLILLFQHTSAGDIHQTTHIIKNITTCPDVGYFFHRETVLNAIDPLPCLLCFCRENSSAVCWRRDASRCDQKNYRHYGKRLARFRRSPAFTDIFFRDAARDVLDKRTPEQCKPYESSFSEGCPPADWCIGCTVCDCDANGRWDCHILSFCPDKKGKKQVQKKKSSLRNKVAKQNNNNALKTTKQATTRKKASTKAKQIVRNTKPPKKNSKTAFKKASEKRSPNMKKGNVKNIQSRKRSHINKSTSKMQKTAIIRTAKPKFIKKKPSTVQQAKRKSYKTALQNVKEKNDTYKLAEAIVKKVMLNVEKYMNENQKKMNNPKVIQKRSMPKHYNDKNKQKGSLNSKKNKTLKKLNKKAWDKKDSLKKQTVKSKQSKREKRSIDRPERNNSTSTVVDTTTGNIIWKNNTRVELFEVSNNNATTTSAQFVEYYKYDIHAQNVSKLPNINDTIYVYNETDREDNTSLHNSMKNGMDNISMKPLVEINYRFKDFIKGNTNNDKWKDLDTLLSKEYTKRIIQQFNGSIIRYNNIVDHISQNKSCGKVCSFKSKLKKLIFGLHPYEKERAGAKVEKINLLKSLKNVFKPLFMRKKISSNKVVQNRKHKNVLNALCKKFHLCHVDLNNKLLQSKLTDLNHETQKILKIISAIRGLLYLLNNATEPKLKNEVEKLDVILRRYYRMDNNQSNITETQRNQIQYVKENTQEFVKSLEKFALTLNDIIRILEKQNKSLTFSNKTPHRYLRCSKRSRRNENQTIDDKITRLKRLLLSYNLIQNKFMSKMYDALVNLQKNTDTTNPIVSEKGIFLNKSIEFENYSRNIIENLRKLKALGQKLNSNERTKRAAMGDEDAIEYLLVLMEYLLKQNKPVAYTPVNDGIDLLIDAIKNAPDIKPLKLSNIVQFTPKKIPTRTTESLENMSYNKAANKYSKENDYAYKQMDSLDKNIYSRNKFKNNLNIIEQYATPSYETNVKEYMFAKSTENITSEVTETIIPVYINKKKTKDENIEERIVKHKFEVFNADGEDEDDPLDTITKRGNRNTEEPFFKVGIDIEKEHEKLLNRIHYDIITTSTEINQNKDNEKNSKLDWGYVNIDSDLKSGVEITTKAAETDRTSKPQLATRTVRRYKDKYANPISGISSEETEDYSKNKVNSKLNKIDIFNSFDYNTEKTEVDSDSKEDKNDAFSDFV